MAHDQSIVLLELTSSATEDDRRAIIESLATLPDRIPAILDYRFGVDAGLAEGNADIGVTADFRDAAGYRDYATHQAHLDVIAEHINPVLATRTAVQIEIDLNSVPVRGKGHMPNVSR